MLYHLYPIQKFLVSRTLRVCQFSTLSDPNLSATLILGYALLEFMGMHCFTYLFLG